VRQEDVAVGEVKPGEQDQLVARLYAVKPVGDGWIDLEQRLRCALECLIRGVGGSAERRPDDADRVHDVPLALRHACKSRTASPTGGAFA
jgi:hypothetical protein